MTEEEIKQELVNNEQRMIECVCNALSNYEIDMRTHLARFVSALCDVEIERMFSDDNHLDVAQARWLFWYAYRYMTGETYEKIGKLSERIYGKSFTKVGVASSVNKMYELIEQQPIWRKRWTIIKRIIKQSESLIEENAQKPIKIIIPKDANVELKRE